MIHQKLCERPIYRICSYIYSIYIYIHHIYIYIIYTYIYIYHIYIHTTEHLSVPSVWLRHTLPLRKLDVVFGALGSQKPHPDLAFLAPPTHSSNSWRKILLWKKYPSSFNLHQNQTSQHLFFRNIQPPSRKIKSQWHIQSSLSIPTKWPICCASRCKLLWLPSGRLTELLKIAHLQLIYPINIVIFHGYVSLPKGSTCTHWA